ncbi:MAG: hypothetical protein HS099_05290 [Ardenticatenaceae bacterium]|nr:hypothetical protein [Ardenticatenaceae bacterium]
MSSIQTSPEITQQMTPHAMLVIWGLYARRIGLVQAIEAIKLKQKTRTHTPQTKVLEFLVAMLVGLAHLQDISRSAHPLDQDHLVAEAWGQSAWADYSGVSRSLSQLTTAEVATLAAALEGISQPFIDQEVTLALEKAGELVYDADLTGHPVSSTSSSYPNTAFGHMGDTIELGYQAALVSLHSPTYGRVWLVPVVPGIVGRWADNALGFIGRHLDEAAAIFRRCSFSADTLVMTEDGLVSISEITLWTLVLAYNEETGEVGYYPVVAIWSHEDPVIVFLTIDGETIVTTPNHPFFASEGKWEQAANLQPGDEIRDAAWGTGTVEAITFTATPQTMYNFTVATAHTYFVGDGQWLVHNCDTINNVFSGRKAMLDDMAQRGVEGAEGFQFIRGGRSHVQINNQDVLASIQETFGSTRGWVKVYEDGFTTVHF